MSSPEVLLLYLFCTFGDLKEVEVRGAPWFQRSTAILQETPQVVLYNQLDWISHAKTAKSVGKSVYFITMYLYVHFCVCIHWYFALLLVVSSNLKLNLSGNLGRVQRGALLQEPFLSPNLQHLMISVSPQCWTDESDSINKKEEKWHLYRIISMTRPMKMMNCSRSRARSVVTRAATTTTAIEHRH